MTKLKNNRLLKKGNNVNKNNSIVLIAAIIILFQMGFDWGAPQKKGASDRTSSAATSAPKSMNGADIPFPQMMNALSGNLKLWSSLSTENKKKAVEAAISIFRDRENSAILQPAGFYVTQIDQGLNANPQMQQADILSIVKMMAVMQYDFYNGQNKEALAKEVLGEQMYQSIRARRQ